LLLLEDGRLGLDDPIEQYLPQLAERRVLRPGAVAIDDTEPARGSITIRHLLSHSAGLSHGLLDPGSVMFEAYRANRVRDPTTSLSAMIDGLAGLPLLFHPGTGWEYSVATDVLGRLVEVISGQRFDRFLRSRILDPLGMSDTGFVVPEEARNRFAALYGGADVIDRMKPGLTRLDNIPYRGANLSEFPRLAGGGGMVSSLPDTVALLRSLMPGGPALLKRETIASMMTNQLPRGVTIHFTPPIGELPGKGFGLAGAVTLTPSSAEPAGAGGEIEWGGIAGTHWWISPKANLAGVLMTQRYMSFLHPFAYEFKRLVYQAAGSHKSQDRS
jgi:CubicO group peptidase (beta-lactamase class C family)